jgi:hypothetical protein
MVERFSHCELMASHCKTLLTSNIVGCKHNKRKLGCQGFNIFQGLHLTSDIHVIIYYLKIFIFHTYLKFFLNISWSYIIYIMHPCFLTYKNESFSFSTHSIYCGSLVIFQRYEIIIINIVHTYVILFIVFAPPSRRIKTQIAIHLVNSTCLNLSIFTTKNIDYEILLIPPCGSVS